MDCGVGGQYRTFFFVINNFTAVAWWFHVGDHRWLGGDIGILKYRYYMWKSECFTVGFFLAAKEMSAIFMQNSLIEHEFIQSKKNQNNY